MGASTSGKSIKIDIISTFWQKRHPVTWREQQHLYNTLCSDQLMLNACAYAQASTQVLTIILNFIIILATDTLSALLYRTLCWRYADKTSRDEVMRGHEVLRLLTES